MRLTFNRYGKQRVRVLKIFRYADRQEAREADAGVLLQGAFEASYLSSDNSPIVATDTVKNTIQLLAQSDWKTSIEEFAQALGRHFLGRYAQVEKVEAEIEERVWQRMSFADGPHPHSFIDRGQGSPFTRVESTRNGVKTVSGVRDMIILKSTGSGFAGYPRCDFTTLPETNDRVFSTSLQAEWTYGRAPECYHEANAEVMEALLETFAKEFSPSVQRTLFQMGEAVLKAVAEIDEVRIAMPNKHYLPVNFKPFGRENAGEILLPTDEPHGQIEGVITRD